MTDEDLRRLCAATVAAGEASPVLIDLCASALDLLSRYYDVLGQYQVLHAANAATVQYAQQQLTDMDTRGTDVPPAPRKKLTKAQKKAKRNAYQRQYLARRREEKKRKLEALAELLQAEEQAPTEQTDVAGTNSGAAPLSPHR